MSKPLGLFFAAVSSLLALSVAFHTPLVFLQVSSSSPPPTQYHDGVVDEAIHNVEAKPLKPWTKTYLPTLHLKAFLPKDVIDGSGVSITQHWGERKNTVQLMFMFLNVSILALSLENTLIWFNCVCVYLHRPGEPGWKVARLVVSAPGPDAYRDGRAYIASDMMLWAPP